MEVISLLQSKNRCLQRLLERSRAFIAEADLIEAKDRSTIATSAWDEKLNQLLADREAIFKALDLYDRKITEAISLLPTIGRTPDLVARARLADAEKDQLIEAISQLDKELISRIEARKARLLENLATSRKSRELAGKFKSTWVAEAGEEFDQTL